MSGHNKWSKVKRIKGPLDAKRGKLFSKLSKEIIVAAGIGGGDAETNARLRQAVTTARQHSMPRENIERAIARGTGASGDARIEEVVYEGYGAGGVAVIVEAATDNKNRTVSELRNLFKSHHGHLAEEGAVDYLFGHFGHLVFDRTRYPEEVVMEAALELEAEDVMAHDGTVEVLTKPSDLFHTCESMAKKGLEPTSVDRVYIPKTTIPVEEQGTGSKLMALLDALEDHDDVQKVHANYQMEEAFFSELAKLA
jgi:YebC/PmpR family DNA-binding regulatory protein